MAAGKSTTNYLLKHILYKTFVINLLQQQQKRGIKPVAVLSLTFKTPSFPSSSRQATTSASNIPIILHDRSILLPCFFTILQINTLHTHQPKFNSSLLLPHPSRHASVSGKRTNTSRDASLPTKSVPSHSSSYAPMHSPHIKPQKYLIYFLNSTFSRNQTNVRHFL